MYLPNGKIDLKSTFENLRRIKAEQEQKEKEKAKLEGAKKLDSDNATVYLPNGKIDLKSTFENLKRIKE